MSLVWYLCLRKTLHSNNTVWHFLTMQPILKPPSQRGKFCIITAACQKILTKITWILLGKYYLDNGKSKKQINETSVFEKQDNYENIGRAMINIKWIYRIILAVLSQPVKGSVLWHVTQTIWFQSYIILTKQ